MSQELVGDLRARAGELHGTHPHLAGLFDRAAIAIEEYRTWIDIVQQESNSRAALLVALQGKCDERDAVLKDLKRLLSAVADALHLVAGKS